MHLGGGVLLCTLIVLCGSVAARVSAGSLAGAQSPDHPIQSPGSPILVADFSVTAIDGRVIRLRDLRGKVVLVNFWATWCSPCRAEIPDLVDLQRQFRDRLAVIGVSVDEGEVMPVKRFADALRVNYPIVMSTPALAGALPAVTSVPTTFVIDREGRLVRTHLGMLDRARTVAEVKVLAGLADGAASPR